jgi:hypothetical protein
LARLRRAGTGPAGRSLQPDADEDQGDAEGKPGNEHYQVITGHWRRPLIARLLDHSSPGAHGKPAEPSWRPYEGSRAGRAVRRMQAAGGLGHQGDERPWTGGAADAEDRCQAAHPFPRWSGHRVTDATAGQGRMGRGGISGTSWDMIQEVRCAEQAYLGIKDAAQSRAAADATIGASPGPAEASAPPSWAASPRSGSRRPRPRDPPHRHADLVPARRHRDAAHSRNRRNLSFGEGQDARRR